MGENTQQEKQNHLKERSANGCIAEKFPRLDLSTKKAELRKKVNVKKGHREKVATCLTAGTAG